MTEPEPLDLGMRAPSFRLRKTFDEKVSLEDLLADGPLLLAFYVFDFGSV
jgi:peroxiredoxin